MTSVALPNWQVNAPVDVDLTDLLNFDDIVSGAVPDGFETSDMQSPLSMRSPSPSVTASPIETALIPVSPTSSCIELELDGMVDEEYDILDPTPWSQMNMSSSVVSDDFPLVSSVPCPPSLKRTISPTCEQNDPQRKKQRTKTTKKTATRAKTSPASKLESTSSLSSEEHTRLRNREHARKSRQRKKSLTIDLQQSLEELKVENAKLREFVERRIGQKTVKSMVASRLASPTDRFIQALKDPSNCVLDENTLSFMQGLRNDLA